MLNGHSIHQKSPRPCGVEVPHGQGFAITFEGLLENKPWKLRTGETIIPNHRGEYVTPGCVANLIDPMHFNYLRFHAAYKDGHLLFEGGLANQPAIVIEAIGVIDSEINRVQDRKQEAAKKKRG